MTRLVARLVLAMLLLPISAALLVICIAALTPTGPPETVSLLAIWAVLYSFIGGYWLLLWRGVVRWNSGRRLNTALAGVAAVVVGAGIGSLMVKLTGAPPQIGILFGGGAVPIVWVLATVLIWRETPKERVERLSRAGRDTVGCPICGYNMTGLHASRCPECGSQFTLDELMAGQPGQDALLPDE